MASYEAGSVTAKVILDTKEFNEAIGKLKSEVGELQSVFNSVKGAKSVSEDVKQLKAEMDKLSTANEDYRKTIKKLREENQNLIKENDKLSKSFDDNRKHINNAIKDLNEYNKAVKRNGKLKPQPVYNYDAMTHLPRQGEMAKFREGLKGQALRDEAIRNSARQAQIVFDSERISAEKTAAALQKLNAEMAQFVQFGKSFRTLQRLSKTTGVDYDKINTQFNLKNTINQAQKAIKVIDRYRRSIQVTTVDYGKLFNVSPTTVGAEKVFEAATRGAERYRERIRLISEELRKYYLENEKYYASVGAMSTKYWKQVRNSSVGGINSNAAYDVKTVGLQDYYKAIPEIIAKANQQLSKQKQIAETIKAQRLDQYYAKAGSASAKYWNQIRSGTVNLNTYKSSMGQINQKISEQTQRTERLRVAQQQLWQKYNTTNLNTYKAHMTEINSALEKQEVNARQAGRGLTSFNNGVVQTAHSGRILSNTLYQIRGALLSLKMIFTAMGGMMLWGFAMDVAESVKETVTAKNEMEAQLNQNSKVDASGIQYFRKELDKLTTTFQKVNKYTVGETVSSIGLEFNLTAKQMADALPIVTMIQSEYVRAGRKTSEAALAVKDILQGEFQRLSRETGVGKEELVAYGWDEDKTNIDGLLKALKKAAFDRHWYIFAKKATSLNDVIEITKSRFSELGAEVVDSLTPAIVGGFNMIIDTITNLSNAFNSLSPFGQNAVFFGGGIAGLTGILTLLPMIVKNMGLAEIATLGWGKSVLTAVFNLNKAEVGMYGFRKALTAVITGTQASEIANVRSTKAIMGRVLGLNQVILKEKGYGTAMVASKLALKEGVDMTKVTMLTELSRSQKLAYLTTNLKYNEAAELLRGKAILKTVTSWKLLRMALFGVMSVGIVSWLVGVATWTSIVKGRVEKYNDVLATGKDKIKEYANDIESYSNKLSELEQDSKKYKQVSRNLNVAQANKQDMEMALKLAKQIKKTDKQTAKDHDYTMKALLNKSYAANGVKNVEKYGQKYMQMRQVAYDIQKSEEERAKFQYSSMQHINEHVAQMEKAGIAEKDKVKYITEYSTKAEEAAQHLKEFNQGNFMSGVYYAMDRLALVWIDLWNDKDFLNFWAAVKKTFEDLKPTLIWVKDTLIDLGRNLMKYFSTDQGRWVGTIIGAGAAFAIIGYKLKGLISPLKSAWGGLKKIGGKLKDVKNGWRSAGDEAEKASEKMGGGKSTGGIAGDGKKQSWGATTWGKIKDDATTYARAAVGIVAGMALITEAIYLLQAPMWALAETGKTFKAKEKSIRAGIEGLQLIAPTVIAILIPVMALVKVMDMWGGKIVNFKTLGGTAVGIAAGMLLVTESIIMLKAPMWALSQLGNDYAIGKDDMQGGIKAIRTLTEALEAMLPVVPIFLAGIALGVTIFTAPEIGLLIAGGAVVGIAASMLLVAEAVVSLRIPLEAIRELGNSFTDVEGAKKGANAIKIAAEALGYVTDAFVSLSLIAWADLGNAIADIISNVIGVDITTNLSELTKEDGFLDKLNSFITEFNKKEFVQIDTDKVTALKGISDGMHTIGDAMVYAKQAMDNLPPEFKGEASTNQYGRTDTADTTTNAEDYFETFKEPLKQLKSFVKSFNESDDFDFGDGIDQSRIDAINQSADMITSLDTAVSKVKDVMNGAWKSDFAASISQEGVWGAVGDLIFGGNGGATGDYVSSMGSSFQEMENIIKDMVTFNSSISGLVGGDNGSTDVSGLTNMVQQVSAEIDNLKNSITNAVPTLKTNSKGLGAAIGDGLKEGFDAKMDTIKPQLGDALKSLGENTLYPNFKTGIDKMSEAMGWELYYVGQVLDERKPGLGTKAYDLGEYMSQQYQSGLDMHSPGLMARATSDEMGFIGQALQGGMDSLPQMVMNLANALTSNFNFDLNLGNLQLPNLDSFQQSLQSITPMVSGVKDQVSINFETMRTNISGSFGGIVSKTQSSLSSMQSATIRNIGNIKSSWRGMQDALIASAENIRKQTGDKISKLKTNMGDFWNKIQHPDQLISGSAGGHTGTIRRRFGGSSRLKGLYAGGIQSSAPNIKIDLEDYLKCMQTDGACYAGGWNFNWTSKIGKKFDGWKTHFGKYKIDDYVSVGKFNNSNFPVKGIAEIAKAYIFDIIRATDYSKYFNSNFGDDPVAALRAGAFNCWDGTNIVLAIARAFGFEGSRGSGTWNGIGHVWAEIPGLGIIDPTAIQQNGTFTSSAVKGYGAAGGGGTIPRRGSSSLPYGDNHTYNTNVEIHVHGDDVEVNNRKIDKKTGKQLLDILGINPSTGR